VTSISGPKFIAPTAQQDPSMENTPIMMDGPELKKAKKRISIIMCILLMAFSIIAGILVGWHFRVLDFSDHAEFPPFSGRTVSNADYGY
jgi:hypothetical protein